MSALSTFFLTLRPVFNVVFLRCVWYVYLLATAIEAFTLVMGSLHIHVQLSQWIFYLIPHFLRTIVMLVFVRLLLELAVSFLSPRDDSLVRER